MFICLPNLRHSFLNICKIITFKVKEKGYFVLAPWDSTLLGSKKTTFSNKYEMSLFGFLFLGELGTCPQNLMRFGTLRKSSISTRGYADIRTYELTKDIFWPKNSIWKILGLKIWMVKICSSASSTCTNYYFWKTLKSWLLVVFQSFSFGQIFSNFGSFGQLWAKFDAFTVAESMPEVRVK